MNDKLAVITGAGGFLGSSIADLLSTEGWRIFGVGSAQIGELANRKTEEQYRLRDLSLPNDEFVRLIKEQTPQVLVHCAGTSLVSKTFQEPQATYDNTVSLCMNMLETLRCHSPETHFIFLSSAAVYGMPEKLPIAEEAPIRPLSPYGCYKAMCELLVDQYRRSLGISGTNLRIFSAFGEGLRKQVLWDLCHKAISDESDELVVRGLEDDSRDFIHCSDIAQAVSLVATERVNENLNLACGVETEIASVAYIIQEVLAPNKEVVFTGEVPAGYPRKWRADINRIKALGFEPRMDVKLGIENYCLWFAEEKRRCLSLESRQSVQSPGPEE